MPLKLIFIGYMGCGKTSIGKLLAKFLSISFYDLDSLIINIESQSIDEIFIKKGEKKFRLMEHNILKDFLKNKMTSYILSVGGGTPCYHNNIIMMKNYAKTFYLKACPNILFQRLKYEKYNRPIIKNFSDSSLLDFIHTHLSKREHFYEQAHEHIYIYNKTIRKISQEIIKIIEI